jgi:cytochrome c5
MRKVLILCCSIALLLVSCKNDNEEETFSNNNGGSGGTTTCDTANVSFSKVIMPMIQNNCLSCHNSTSPKLSNYDQIAQNATRILGAIKHQPGYKAMPPGGSLPQCNILQFEAWVKQGKKNN